MLIKGKEVAGAIVDEQTRCTHYASEKDIIAIKFPCCHTYYPCIFCHQEYAGHDNKVWTKEQFNEKAILCGSCGNELTIQEYLDCGSACPVCHANFNPKCELHHAFYFEV